MNAKQEKIRDAQRLLRQASELLREARGVDNGEEYDSTSHWLAEITDSVETACWLHVYGSNRNRTEGFAKITDSMKKDAQRLKLAAICRECVPF